MLAYFRIDVAKRHDFGVSLLIEAQRWGKIYSILTTQNVLGSGQSFLLVNI